MIIWGKFRGKKNAKKGIVDTCFTFVAVIGGKLFINTPKNHNHVNKCERDILFGIITVVTNFSGGDTIFYNGVRIYNLVQRDHVLKH